MKKILIIEDNNEVRENIEEILALVGYETFGAADGTSGVELAVNEEPDLILCDVMMPKLDGFGVLNILSKKPETADIPFIFLTAKTEASDFRRGMNLGADDYITKPFLKDDLLRVIEIRLNKSERLQKKYDRTKDAWISFINEQKGYDSMIKLAEEYPVKTYRKKEELFEEGKLPRSLFYITSGKVKIYKTNEYGKEFILNIRKEGDFIGYSALIKGQVYNFASAALENVEARVIPKNEFLKLFFSNQHVALHMIKMLADNVAEKEEQLLTLAYYSVRKRIANALLFLHGKYFEEEQKQTEIRTLRDAQAHLVGTAKESVIRMLTEFKDDGYINIVEGKIIIPDMEKLESIPG